MILSIVFGAFGGIGAFLLIRDRVLGSGSGVLRMLRHKMVRQRATDRRILRITDDEFVAEIFLRGLVGLGFGFGVVTIVHLAGFRIAPPIVAFACVAVTTLPAVMYVEKISKEAQIARRGFRFALSSYLDLASVLLAGGAGSETALSAAASTGNNWSFRLIRDALDSARAGRAPVWKVFGDLGRDLGVTDLERLAGSMQLAGEQGSRVRASLVAQAEAMRIRQIADIEADAQAATERMGIPTVLLFVGFIALLGYPALELVVGQM